MPAKRLDLSHLRDDKIAFISRVLKHPNGDPCIPFEAQIDILRGIARVTVVLAGRQFGKSTVLGWDGAHYITTHAHRQVYCIAPSVDQARIIFDEIASHFRPGKLLSALVDGKIVDFPFPHFKLTNGTEVHGRGANSPQFIRGHRAHRVYCDEADFVKDKVLTDVIEPMFTVTGKEPDSALVLTSTPFAHGYFFDTFELGRLRTEGYASFRYTSEDNPHADQAFLARQKARYGEDSLIWRTEYLAEFPDTDLGVFPWADIKWAYEHWPQWSGEQQVFPVAPVAGHRYVQGVDLGNRRDYFVATMLDVTDPAAVPLVRYNRLQQRDYPTYKGIVRSNWADFSHPRTLVDATSLGESVVQDLRDIGAEGYTIGTNAAKHEIVHELKRMLSERRLLLPYDRTIIDELRYFEYDVTPAKVVRMEAKKGHDDIVMSLALAAHLATRPTTLGLFHPVDFTADPFRAARGAGRDAGADPFAALWAFDEDEDGNTV